MTCDHLVAYGGDSQGGPLLESERHKTAISSLRDVEGWLAAGLGVPSAVAHARTLDTPEKALADDFDMFAYCPRCGEKLMEIPKTELEISQVRGDAWRDIYSADTALICALRVQLLNCQELVTQWRGEALIIKSKMGDESDHEYGADSAAVHFLANCANELEEVLK